MDTTRIELIPVKGSQDIRRVAGLAKEIWREHYPSMIGSVQVEYMLDKFQSVDAIAEQINSGQLTYYLAVSDGGCRGYTACAFNHAASELFISKLYVLHAERGRGIGNGIISFLEGLAARNGLAALTLTVNRNNSSAIGFYERNGFLKAGDALQDIGNGFFMDDYRMVKVLRGKEGKSGGIRHS